MGPFHRFMHMLNYTPILDNPDSWEGWHWGATHTYGFHWRLGMPPQFDLLEDGLKNTEMIVFWSNDPDSTRGTYSGQESAIWRVWLKEKGVKTVFIDPFYNYTNAAMDGTWLAPRPGSDTALAMAIAYVWITEGHLRQEVHRGEDRRLRRVQGLHSGRGGRQVRQDAGVGRAGIRHSGAQDSCRWPVNGQQSAPSCQLRQPRRRRQRLPHRLWHRVGAHDGAVDGHARTGQAGHQHLGHHHGSSGQSRHLVSRPMPSRAGQMGRAPIAKAARSRLRTRPSSGFSGLPSPRPFSPARKISAATAFAARHWSSSSFITPIRWRATPRSRCSTATAVPSWERCRTPTNG